MAVGEKKTIEIKCSEAYGEYNDGMIQEVPKSQMPGEVEIGMSLQSQTEMGVIQFLVKEIKEESVILDANHKLAGKDLIFDLEVLEIQ
jgi:FKBP-type peptidyl-prolyl cis-trans isomerase SlpA